MPIRLYNRERVRELAERGAQLVDVLPREEYEFEHIAGAVHVPLKKLDRIAPERLNPARPVVAYCYDFLCDLSPRAALRLERLGFAEVYDYVPGRVDWTAAGLPRQGESAELVYAGDLAVPDVPTCRPDAPLAEARDRAANGSGFCVVTTADRMVLGLLHADASETGETAEAAMREGPTTVRANEPAGELLARLRKANVELILITDPEGRLLGVFERAHAELHVVP